MSKIATYSLADSPLQLSDRLIGTEAPRTPPSITPLATKNFSLGELLQLFSSNFPAATLQAVLNAGNIATQDITLTGTIYVDLIKPTNIEDMLGSQGTPFQVLSKAIGGFNWVDPPVSITLTTTGSSGPSTLISGVLNIPVYAGGVTPNLQEVLIQGNTSNGSIILENSDYLNNLEPAAQVVQNKNTTAGVGFSEQGVDIFTNNSSLAVGLKTDNITESYIAQLPNKTGGAEETFAMVSDITIPTLQQVTDEGNITTNDIIVRNPDDALKQVVIHRPDAGDDTAYVFAQYDADTTASISATENQASINTLDTNGSVTLNSGALQIESADYQMLLQQAKLALTSLVDQPYIFMSCVDGSVSINTDLLDGAYTQQLPPKDGTFAMLDDIPAAGVTSVGLTMPSAFTVTNSPITSSGDIAVTGAGAVSQYVRGDGTLANFPTSSGGGSSLSFYLNGSVSQGTFGGVAFKEMDRTPILGAGTDFTINANGYIQSFITDAGVPNLLEIPAGNWNFETYFSASSGGGSPSFYVELYKWNGTTLSLIASNSATPEFITGGTSIDLYVSALAVPQTSLLATDRLAVRIYVTHSGRTITLHTEDNNLCQVITTFSTGLTALNGLTAQVQNLATGTSGTDFGIVSSGSTHTFNLPNASASNRGLLTSADWSTFNAKQNALGYSPIKKIVSDTVSSSAVTGVTTETLCKTYTISANTFADGDFMKVLIGLEKTGVLGTATARIRVNQTNNFATATLVGTYTPTAGSHTAILFKRDFLSFKSGVLKGISFNTNNQSDLAAGASIIYSTTTLSPTSDFYIYVSVINVSLTDSTIVNQVQITN